MQKCLLMFIKFAKVPVKRLGTASFCFIKVRISEAIDVMLLLACDEECDTRNWAMFVGLDTN